MVNIVLLLNFATSICFTNRAIHAVSALFRIHDHATFQVSSRATNRLNQRTLTSQKSFFIRIKNGNK